MNITARKTSRIFICVVKLSFNNQGTITIAVPQNNILMAQNGIISSRGYLVGKGWPRALRAFSISLRIGIKKLAGIAKSKLIIQQAIANIIMYLLPPSITISAIEDIMPIEANTQVYTK